LAINNGRFRGLFVSFILMSIFGTIILVVWYGTTLVQHGAITFGGLTAFVVYTAFVGGSMAGFADLYSQLQKTLGATQRVREILRDETEPVTVVDEPVEEKNKLQGAVTFKQVAFSYPSRKEVHILKEVNITAAPGEQIAIVGPSGAGKSTIAALLLHFYHPDKGNLLFDGKPADS